MITLQALQPNGEWHIRAAFIDQNKMVRVGQLQEEQLEKTARELMVKWTQNYPDGKLLRVHNSKRRLYE